MDRLQRKCVVASVSLHGLLAAVLVFGPAFLVPASKTVNMDVLTVIPDILVDAPLSNPGGNPNVKSPPAPAPLAQPQPRPPAPAPSPPKPEPAVKPEPVAPKDPVPQKPPDEPDFMKSASGKRQVIVNSRPSVRKPDPRAKTPDANTAAEAEQRAATARNNQVRAALKGAAESIGNVVSSSTSVGIPGPGGLAYANYAQFVKTIYTDAWMPPADINDDNATTKASVTIARDGTVVSWKIVAFSGNAVVDSSVRSTLERVRTIGREFPVGAKEDQRTFTISFNLKAKRQLG